LLYVTNSLLIQRAKTRILAVHGIQLLGELAIAATKEIRENNRNTSASRVVI
jgi:hypothetical protein